MSDQNAGVLDFLHELSDELDQMKASNCHEDRQPPLRLVAFDRDARTFQ